MIGNSPEYDAFVAKFKARHTSDDTFTPENIYNCVRDWCVRRYGLDGAKIVRPFWPGEDFTKAEYPEGCVVIDNPPFSICSKIVRWFNDHGIRFFLFCPGLSAIRIIKDKRSSLVASGSSIYYDNGAVVPTGFVTNLAGDVLIEAAPDLHDAIEAINDANRAQTKKHVQKYKHPHGTITAAGANYLAVHHTPYTLKKDDAVFISRLDCGTELFGGGFLLSERAAAERAAAERAAAERAAAHVLKLSPREIALQKSITRQTPFKTR